jgi:hypothetical protein
MGKHTKPRLVDNDFDTTATASNAPGESESGPAAAPAAINFEITVFEKTNGPLTKSIRIVDGRLVSDSRQCRMANGTARRVRIGSLQELADIINTVGQRQALALGRLRDDVGEAARVVRKREVAGTPGAIARSKDFLEFKKGVQGLCLFDFDANGLPEELSRHIRKKGLWEVLTGLTRPCGCHPR